MTSKIAIRYNFFSQLPHPTAKKFIISFKAAEIKEYLKKWDIPLQANLRQPKSNFVTDDIVKDIRTGVLKALPDSIHVFVHEVYCHSGVAYLDFGGDLLSGNLFGFMNGGHRLLAFRNALLQGLDIDNIEIKFEIYQGFSFAEIQQIAIALNQSKQVKVTSIINHGGGYDWIKPHLREFIVRYQENDLETPSDPYCSIERILWLTHLINMEYNPGGENWNKRHPTSLGDSSKGVSRKGVERLTEKYLHMVKELVLLQTQIALEWDRRARGARTTKIRFISEPKDKKKNTHLPTGEILSCRLPSRAFIAPILSAYRALLKGGVDDSNPVGWLYGASFEDVTLVSQTMIPRMVNRYIEILSHKGTMSRSVGAIGTDPALWSDMYNIGQACQTQLCNTVTKKVAQKSASTKRR